MKIPAYRSQVEVPDAGRGLPRLDPSAAARAGAGLIQAAATAADAAQILRRSNEHAAAQEAARAAAEARSDWLARHDALQNEAPAGAPEFTRRVMEEFDRDRQKRIEAVSPLARDYLGVALAKVGLALKAKSMAFESASRLGQQLRDIDTTLNVEINSVRADETQFDAAYANGMAAIAAAQIDADNKAKVGKAFERGLARAVFRGAIERDPAGARKRLEAGEFAGALQEGDYDTLLNQATARAEHLRALEAAEVKSLARDHIASIQETGEGLKGVVERAKASFSPAAFAELLKAEKFARDYHAAAIGINFAPPDAIAATVAQFKPAPGSDGYADRLRLYEGLARRADQILKFRDKDPAGYAMTSPDVRAAFERAAADPAAYERALTARVEFQQSMGAAPKVLSEAEANDAAARVLALPAAERASAMGQLMAGYGRHAARALGQLAEAGLDARHQVLATLAGDPVASAKMATAIGLGHKELAANIPEDERKAVHETLAADLAAFRRVFEWSDPSGGAAPAFNNIVAAIRDLALVDVRAGVSAQAAARAAAEGVIGSRYHVIESRRVKAYAPKAIAGEVIDPGAVETAAAELLTEEKIRAFEPLPFEDGGGDELLARERTVRAAVNSGFWATDSTGEGMVLMVPFRGGAALPLLDKARRPYRLAFADTNDIRERIEAEERGRVAAP
jgi:hypothetical protein